MEPNPSTPAARAAGTGRRVARWHRMATGAALASTLACGLSGWMAADAATGKPAPSAPVRAGATALPEVNLRIDWRQVDEVMLDEPRRGGEAVVVGTGSTSTSSTGGKQWSTERRRSDDFGLQGVQVQVRNGGSVQLQWQRDLSVEWVAEALLPSGSGMGGPSGSGGAGRGAASPGTVTGVSRQLVWLPSGQRLALHARWPGGATPVSVDVDIDERSLEPASSGGVPQQSRRRVESTVLAPLGAWVTLARSPTPAEGDAAAPSLGTTSTLALRPPRTLLQLRVSVVGGVKADQAAGRR